MIPGPDQIVACPHCEALAKYRTLVSGNTFGARVWTDGKQVAPMLPRPPAVARCRNCSACYWLSEAREVGTVSSGGRNRARVDPARLAAEYVEEPNEEEYLGALAAGLAREPEQELTLRRLAWWRGNDPFRSAPPSEVGPPASDARRENLLALAHLLNGADEDSLLTKVEVLRHLGAFKAALEVLGRVTAPQYADVVSRFRELCEKGDCCVRLLR
jgi:hypothetical protein